MPTATAQSTLPIRILRFRGRHQCPAPIEIIWYSDNTAPKLHIVLHFFWHMINKYILSVACVLLLGCGTLRGYVTPDSALTLSLYVDTYYAIDDDNTSVLFHNKEARQLSTVGLYRDQLGVNLAQIGAVYSKPDIRARVTLQAGTLAQIGWDGLTEHPFVQEANAGVRLVDNLWLDAGYFLGHIGGELLAPKDNWISSHAIITMLEPFYESGVSATYTFPSGVEARLYLINGYNVIEDDNANRAAGVYVALTTENFSVSYAGHYGNEHNYALGGNSLRIYNNIVLWTRPVSNFEVEAQFDLATQDDAPTKGKMGMMSGAAIAFHYSFTDSWGMAVRGEYFDDRDNVVSTGLKGMGITGSIEYKPTPTSYIRAEGRLLRLSDDYELFLDSNRNPTPSRKEAMMTFGIWI